MDQNISITKDNLNQYKDRFWVKVIVVASLAFVILFSCTWYAYKQGFVKGYKKGFLEFIGMCSCDQGVDIQSEESK
jgi:hypothetical protein